MRYHREGDVAAREQLAERFLPLARDLALRYAHTDESFDDLLQVASLCLVKAIDRFAGDVNDSVRLLAEMLVADHCHEPIGTAKRYDDELSTVAGTLQVTEPRVRLRRDPSLPDRNTPDVSPKSRRSWLNAE